LLLAVAVQTQFIGGYTGYSSLLPAATSLQWLPQGQPFPSIFNPVYPAHVNYRGIAVGSAGAPWYFYNPSAISYASYPQSVQVSADVKDAAANTGAAGSTRTRRQIQLRYGSGRRGRSLNAEIIEPETSPATEWESLDTTPASRTKRQIQLRYGGRRGRSLNGIVEPETATKWKSLTDAAPASRTQRQIQLRYGSGRRGRSLNAEMIEPETSPDTQWKSVDSAPSRTKRQIQLRYGGRRGRSLNEMVEPETDGRDHESVTLNDPSRAKRQIQLRYRSGYGGYRRGRSLNEPVQFELDRAKRQILLRYRSSARRRQGRSLDTLWTTA
jgi:hypothetical protein